jgi:PAS domain S-box-containing protein
MPTDEPAVPLIWDPVRPGDDARGPDDAHAAEATRLAVALEEANRQLREANAKYQAMWEQGLFAGLLTTDGTIIVANRSSLAVAGVTRDEVIGKRFWDTPWWNGSPAVQAWLQAGFAEALSGNVFRGESVYFVADGSERIVDFA